MSLTSIPNPKGLEDLFCINLNQYPGVASNQVNHVTVYLQEPERHTLAVEVNQFPQEGKTKQFEAVGQELNYARATPQIWTLLILVI